MGFGSILSWLGILAQMRVWLSILSLILGASHLADALAQSTTPAPIPDSAWLWLPNAAAMPMSQPSTLPPEPVGPPPAAAAVGADLTLADLEAMAFGDNPTLPQAAAAIDQERGVWQQAGLYPNPQIGYLRTDASRADQSRTDGMFLSQEIVTAHKRQLARGRGAGGEPSRLGARSPADACAERPAHSLLRSARCSASDRLR
jgi:hypothetical protein